MPVTKIYQHSMIFLSGLAQYGMVGLIGLLSWSHWQLGHGTEIQFWTGFFMIAAMFAISGICNYLYPYRAELVNSKLIVSYFGFLFSRSETLTSDQILKISNEGDNAIRIELLSGSSITFIMGGSYSDVRQPDGDSLMDAPLYSFYRDLNEMVVATKS